NHLTVSQPESGKAAVTTVPVVAPDQAEALALALKNEAPTEPRNLRGPLKEALYPAEGGEVEIPSVPKERQLTPEEASEVERVRRENPSLQQTVIELPPPEAAAQEFDPNTLWQDSPALRASQEPQKTQSIIGQYRAQVFLGAAAAAVVFWVLYYSGQNSEPTKRYVPSVSDWLAWCSPFESLDGKRHLVFDNSDHSVVMEEAVDKNSATAKQTKKDGGTWSADELSKSVTTEFAEAKHLYLLVIPSSEDQCI